MASPQKSITLSIVRALNWDQTDTHEELELAFYSVISKGLILEKNIRGSAGNRQLAINTSLKITYTAEESQILLRMSRRGEDGAPCFLSELLIDFDLLQERRVQYLPFDKNGRVLEVVSGLQPRDDSRDQKSVASPAIIDTFIQQKSDYLKSMNAQNSTVNWLDEKVSSNKNFTEKLYALLREARRLRQKIDRQKGGQQQQPDTASYNTDGFNKNSEMSSNGEEAANERFLVKSSSENLLGVNGLSKKGENKEGLEGRNKRWKAAPHYKLDLKSLAIIDPNRMREDAIRQDEDEVLRSKQEGFSSFKGSRHQLSAYLPNINQNG